MTKAISRVRIDISESQEISSPDSSCKSKNESLGEEGKKLTVFLLLVKTWAEGSLLFQGF